MNQDPSDQQWMTDREKKFTCPLYLTSGNDSVIDLDSDLGKQLIAQGADPKFLATLRIPPIPEGAKLGFMIVSPQEYRACCKQIVKALIPIVEQAVKDGKLDNLGSK